MLFIGSFNWLTRKKKNCVPLEVPQSSPGNKSQIKGIAREGESERTLSRVLAIDSLKDRRGDVRDRSDSFRSSHPC